VETNSHYLAWPWGKSKLA